MLSSLHAAKPADSFVYFGTYTNAKTESKGIYRSRLDGATGQLSPAELVAPASDPAFLALHPNGRFLYALDESADVKRTPGQGLKAYALNPNSGALTFLNEISTGSSGACHLAIDATGQSLLVANYGGGSVSALTLRLDGRLGALASLIQHQGKSVNPNRQEGPHPHGVYPSPDNHFVFVPDLGLDTVFCYLLDAPSAKLTRNTMIAGTSLKAGSGPRHLAFHPYQPFTSVINELFCTIDAFRYDAAGSLTHFQTISTLPPGEAIPKGTSTAEIQVHPNGRFLYGSNRGANTLVVYRIEEKSGQLTYVESVSTLGQTPRHFALDPSGTWLLAENQDDNTVTVFRVDSETGHLTPTGQRLAVPSPVCAVFVPAP
jgi:6-phosphogluconolactonase